MVTHWKGHWDGLRGGETSYTEGMLRNLKVDEIREGIPTIFIRLDRKGGSPVRAWEGTISDVRVVEEEKKKIYFRVHLEREIPVPEKYAEYDSGWYVDREEDELLIPSFFRILKTTRDWKTFEEYTYHLLKLLGINNIVKLEDQSGKADGFFRIGNLAVIYDCTLDPQFEERKEAQMNNYCNQLKRGVLRYRDIEWSVAACEKRVWIITRGTRRTIKRYDSILVKEVPVDTLIEVYFKRLEGKVLTEDQLVEMLRNL